LSKDVILNHNIDIGCISGNKSEDSIIPLAKIFVLVPTRVQHPPQMEAYETGISILEEETSSFLEREITTGNKTTTTGVLLINAETKATKHNNTRINFVYPK